MTNRFRVLRIERVCDLENVRLTLDEYIESIRDNRVRIRTLAGMVLTACSILLSASFVILFFLVRSGPAPEDRYVVVLLFGAALFLICAIGFGVLSAFIPRPSAVQTKGDRLSHLTDTYRREYRRATISVMCLFIGVVSFLGGLVVFAVKVLG